MSSKDIFKLLPAGALGIVPCFFVALRKRRWLEIVSALTEPVVITGGLTGPAGAVGFFRQANRREPYIIISQVSLKNGGVRFMRISLRDK